MCTGLGSQCAEREEDGSSSFDKLSGVCTQGLTWLHHIQMMGLMQAGKELAESYVDHAGGSL